MPEQQPWNPVPPPLPSVFKLEYAISTDRLARACLLASMPHVKSPYPPVPDLPDLNYFTLLFETSPGKDHPQDYVVQVDVETGEKRTYREFVDRIRDCATGLAAPVEQGGLGIKHDAGEQEIVAIFSPNCLVCSDTY